MTDIRAIADDILDALVIPSYTDLGILARRRLHDWEDLSRLTLEGRVILVTGATSGLGLETARQLLTMGASLRLLVRNPERAAAACERLRQEIPTADVRYVVADMSDLQQVRGAAAEILATEDRLDALVHNAGAIIPERRTSTEGVELTFASMVLGPFVLTEVLAPLLLTTARRHRPARIITVASGGIYTQRLHVDDLQMERGPYRGAVAYARAKRAQITLTTLWSDRLWQDGVLANAMHPGWADTPAFRQGLPLVHRLIGSRLRTPEEGADTIVWLAASPEAARWTGMFWHDRRARPTERVPGTRVSPTDARALWDACDRLSA